MPHELIPTTATVPMALPAPERTAPSIEVSFSHRSPLADGEGS
jgi:hypothetical protein